MLKDSAIVLRRRLVTIGLSERAINAAWPTWWSDAADASSSARAELRYSVARKLGIDPHSLLEDETTPRFVWNDEARFKHLAGETAVEKSALTSFGAAVGGMLVAATAVSYSLIGESAKQIRTAILDRQPYVALIDLISLSWSLGIPSIHLRIFPWPQKRMAAMSVGVGQRSAILLAKDSDYPAQIAFYLAHELAHVFLGHVGHDKVIIDLEPQEAAALSSGDDPEELEADAFALELLTGEPQPIVLPTPSGASARTLAATALNVADELRIEPGTLALCFGHSTRDWPTAIASLRHIYATPKPVWKEINGVAMRQLTLMNLPDDTLSYLQQIMGTTEE
jgi:Zn-dependent peptidase ImmA (M78 family)